MSKSRLPWMPVRDLMKSIGANIAARDAVDLVVKAAEDYIKRITSSALKLARHSRRTKVSRDDVDAVLKSGW